MDKRGKNVGVYRAYKGKKVVSQTASDPNVIEEPAKIDMTQKIRLGVWHPNENTFAVAKYNSLFLYTEKKL
jgi:hypothetical protein